MLLKVAKAFRCGVFVLLKVFEEDVAKHRLAIAEEKKRLEPPPQDEWVVFSLISMTQSRFT